MEVEIEKDDLEITSDLASFFDALARFDFEDNKLLSLPENNFSELNS
jgi:hypothetical protein